MRCSRPAGRRRSCRPCWSHPVRPAAGPCWHRRSSSAPAAGCLRLSAAGRRRCLFGGVQCGCGGVGLGLCFGHAGRGCLCDGLVGFHCALLGLCDAVLRLCDGLLGLVVCGCGFVGHGDCRRGEGGHYGCACHCDLGEVAAFHERSLLSLVVPLWGLCSLGGVVCFPPTNSSTNFTIANFYLLFLSARHVPA